jgi:hypothetical protein
LWQEKIELKFTKTIIYQLEEGKGPSRRKKNNLKKSLEKGRQKK